MNRREPEPVRLRAAAASHVPAGPARRVGDGPSMLEHASASWSCLLPGQLEEHALEVGRDRARAR